MNDELTIKILNNVIALDYKCDCPDFIKDDTGVCGYCKGTGYHPTQIGQAIIELIERHIIRKV